MRYLIPLWDKDGYVCAYSQVGSSAAEPVSAYRWRLGGNSYATRSAKSEVVYMHRSILGLRVGDTRQVDHINHDRLDNTATNLRVVTPAEQNQNLTMHPSNKSGYRGVSWYRRDSKWRAYVTLGRKQMHLGYFESVDAAGAAASEARKRLMPFAVEP